MVMLRLFGIVLTITVVAWLFSSETRRPARVYWLRCGMAEAVTPRYKQPNDSVGVQFTFTAYGL